METVAMLPANGLDAAEQIIEFAETKGIRLRLLGGLAFKRMCPSANQPRYYRENKDIDLMGRRDDYKAIVKILGGLGYRPREVFNTLSMGQRLIYYDLVNRRRVDVFLDEFVMCHKFNFKQNLLPDAYTLPMTQLIMTKLQVVEKTDKEYLDLIAGFRDFNVTSGEGEIDAEEVAEICSRDWGIYTTFRKSLEALRQRALALSSDERSVIVPRVEKLISAIEDRPKSFGWKMRARIGEKARWYEIPDSDGDAMLD